MAILGAGFEPSDMVTGHAITDIAQNESSVRITLTDGTARSGSLLIGAEGVRSTVRPSVRDEPGMRTARFAAESWRSVAPNPGVPRLNHPLHDEVRAEPLFNEALVKVVEARDGGLVFLEQERHGPRRLQRSNERPTEILRLEIRLIRSLDELAEVLQSAAPGRRHE